MAPTSVPTGALPVASRRGRVLIVDDHELNLKLLERLLELEGREVRAADSLAAAERALAEEEPAMIVLDLNLPDGNGLELTRKLKSEPRTASIPIVACTAAVMPADEDRALEAGCDAFVAKPIDLRRFSEVISSILA
ncbi:MAG: response regulator [Solirubrobacterales bacterium]|nr:response regulator [Solirubrobacterales bacterium]